MLLGLASVKAEAIQGIGVILIGASEANMRAAGFQNAEDLHDGNGADGWCQAANGKWMYFNGSMHLEGVDRPAHYEVCVIDGKVVYLTASLRLSNAFYDSVEAMQDGKDALVRQVRGAGVDLAEGWSGGGLYYIGTGADGNTVQVSSPELTLFLMVSSPIATRLWRAWQDKGSGIH